MQVIRSPRVHPVVIIGSGASGGMAAWNLTAKGVRVLLLDAGERFDRTTFWTHVQPWEARERTARGERPPQFYLDLEEQPYLTPPDRPFGLTRVWGHGGKTNVWGRVSLRYAELDFKGAERDGWEIPWPISYADVARRAPKIDDRRVVHDEMRFNGADRSHDRRHDAGVNDRGRHRTALIHAQNNVAQR